MHYFSSFHLQLHRQLEGDVEGDLELAVNPEKTKLQPPPMYQVLLLNDDFTPMDFVVEVLGKYFNLPEEVAVQIMLTVHTQG